MDDKVNRYEAIAWFVIYYLFAKSMFGYKDWIFVIGMA